MSSAPLEQILAELDATRAEREQLYMRLHQNPELSFQEHATAATLHDVLTAEGVEVTRIGVTGLVATLANGEGPTVAMRGDIDALPVKEKSGKEYASTATQVDERTGVEVPVSHACGHDFHAACLVGALIALHRRREHWSGTFVGVFQPAEEIAAGAQDMLDNGLAEAMPTPDVYLGQHVLSSLPGGHVGATAGPVLSSGTSIKVTVHGKGSHGSMPELGVDPVVLASSIVMRLQTIVAREIPAGATAVVTVGSLQAGTKSNIIPDSAQLLINTRAYDENVAQHLHAAIERIVHSECAGARSPREPEFKYYDVYPLTDNDEAATKLVRSAFDEFFGDASTDLTPVPASEDFSVIPDALGVPYVYWGIGGFADQDNAPGNHNPAFAPDLQPTLDVGTQAIIVAAAPWLLPETQR
jgi:amidohydrolase